MEDVWDPKVQKYDLFLKKILDLDLQMTFQGQNVKVVVETRFFFKMIANGKTNHLLGNLFSLQLIFSPLEVIKGRNRPF